MAAVVTVYNSAGDPEKHSVANARDLVANSKYSWKPGRQWTPIESAPYARPHLAKAGDKVQELLDRAGTPTGKAVVDTTVTDTVADSDPVMIEEEAFPMPRIVPDEEDASDDDVDSSDLESASDAPAPRRGGRKPKDA